MDLTTDPRYLHLKQREKRAMDDITSASQAARQRDALPRLESQIQGLAASRDSLAGKLESISHAASDAGQRTELQTGLDQADQQLQNYQAQHERIVRGVNHAVVLQNQAADELNTVAAEIAELSRGS